ncbi:metabotropic glutamate receptor-like [Pollicipes pollicipes]|uniref:metabotropic glutamate receptor-like n=1 Tax=Pollicipes pollicipes TaxID=41117 RepID=UPI00188502A3|nr:metabotropic glutamate receptor-like [Pollicipes pollicipes]
MELTLWLLAGATLGACGSTWGRDELADDNQDDRTPFWQSQPVFGNYSGDILLGALFPVHRMGADGLCGRIQNEDGMQPLEAMLFTLDTINRSPALLPGIRLGAIVFDSCDSALVALERSMEFVKGFFSRVNTHHRSEFVCGDGKPPVYGDGSYQRMVGVIGGQSSAVSIQVANLLRNFEVPQISYLSTSTTLSGPKYSYFFRTVPSDVNQATAILEILRAFNWTHASLVYSNSDYGNRGYEKLEELAASYGVCFSTPLRLDDDRHNHDDVLESLATKTDAKGLMVPSSRFGLDINDPCRLCTNGLRETAAARSRSRPGSSAVVVVFADKMTTGELMRRAKQLDVTHDLVWIGSDAWSSRETVVHGVEDVIEGTISVQPLVENLSGFDDYMAGLDPLALPLARNPWLAEFWEDTFACALPGAAGGADGRAAGEVAANRADRPACDPTLRLTEQSGYRQQKYLHFVRDATWAFANALNDMHLDLCKGQPGLCSGMQHIEGYTLRQYLSKVHFKVTEDGSSNLVLRREEILFKAGGRRDFPTSECGTPCLPHQVKVKKENDLCCWTCRTCGSYQVVRDDYDCEECKPGFLPSPNQRHCMIVPVTFVDYSSPWAVVAMTFAAFGIVVTVLCGLIFAAHASTPVIKASGRELSYLLLVGNLLSFGMTFLIVARPTDATCGLTRFFLGLCYTVCYAAIVTKTNRTSRIFTRRPVKHRTRYTSPQSQLVITAILTSVEVIVNAIWLLYRPPATLVISPTREQRVLICDGLDDSSYLIGLIYPLILIGFCTIYAVKTRKCPGGFNEARYIVFTSYTTCVLWLAFVPLYIAATDHALRTVTLAMSLSLSGLVQLACLFFPKIYVVVFKPEKNTRDAVMAHRSHAFIPTCHSTPVVLINGTSRGVYARCRRGPPLCCRQDISTSSGSDSQGAPAAGAVSSPLRLDFTRFNHITSLRAPVTGSGNVSAASALRRRKHSV